MERILQSLRVGPHRVDALEIADEQGGGYVMVLVDGAVAGEPLDAPPTREELLALYARWQARRGRDPSRPAPPRADPIDPAASG